MANVYHIYHIYGGHSYFVFYTLHVTCMAESTRAFVNRAICNNVYIHVYVKNTYTCHAQHIFLELNWFVSLPILFSFHECEGVGATSYKKWPVLTIIQLSHPLTRYFVRPKKPEIYETESPHLERMRNANYASLRHFAFPYMSMRYRVYYCVWVRNAAKKLSFDKKLGTGLL